MTRFITIFCFAFAALLTSSVNAQFVDDFDSYGTGVNVDGMNGWQGWDGVAAASASTSADQALSDPNSIAITDTTDLINRLDANGQITSGRWLMTVDQYIPSPFVGSSFFIMQNTYNDGGPYNWSVELQFFGAPDDPKTPEDESFQVLVDDFQLPQSTGWGGAEVIQDQWVQIKVCIDLDQDTVRQYYDGVLIPNTQGETGLSWTERGNDGDPPDPPGDLAIGSLNLFATAGASTVFYDNVELKQVVLGDANDDGEFNNTDISWFVLALTNAKMYAMMFPDVDPDCVLDMNGDGLFDNTDIADFVAALTG